MAAAIARLAEWVEGTLPHASPRTRSTLRALGRALRTAERAGCRSCGRCCELFGATLTASPKDLERWRREGRDDLLARASPLGRLWFDPDTGQRLPRCPHLVRIAPGRARCRIHATKPQICRDYPTLAHGKRCVANRLFPINH
ncbi:YkgJ family cysteine cluster protein [Deferrisoma sp.]